MKKALLLVNLGTPDKPTYLSVFKYCLGKLLYFEENLGQFETRNPFNRGYIY